MGNRVQRVKTDVSESQMAQAIIAGWKSLFGDTPSKEQVSMVLAQNDLETGHRKSMWNYNVGNITTNGSGPYDFFDDLSTNEQVSPGQWKKMNLKYRAYPSLEEGVRDYLKLLSGKHYADAWQHILHPDPAAFSKALKSAGYYTANEAPYTKALTNLFNQNSKSNSYELAMSGKTTKPASGEGLAPTAPQQEMIGMDNALDRFVQMLSAASSLKRLYKVALTNNDILIKIAAPDHICAVEFARVLCAALDEDLLATTYPCTDGWEVEIECAIAGPSVECLAAVMEMSEAIADSFQEATQKVGGISVKTNCLTNKKSSYQPISPTMAGSNHRKFLLKLAF